MLESPCWRRRSPAASRASCGSCRRSSRAGCRGSAAATSRSGSPTTDRASLGWTTAARQAQHKRTKQTMDGVRDQQADPLSLARCAYRDARSAALTASAAAADLIPECLICGRVAFECECLRRIVEADERLILTHGRAQLMVRAEATAAEFGGTRGEVESSRERGRVGSRGRAKTRSAKGLRIQHVATHNKRMSECASAVSLCLRCIDPNVLSSATSMEAGTRQRAATARRAPGRLLAPCTHRMCCSNATTASRERQEVGLTRLFSSSPSEPWGSAKTHHSNEAPAPQALKRSG